MSKTATTGFHITEDEMVEWTSLTDAGEIARGKAHRKSCKKQGLHPTPPSKWIACPICGHRCPGSLVSHYKTAHGGMVAAAKILGIFEEELPVVTDDMMARFKEYGAQGNEAKKTA